MIIGNGFFTDTEKQALMEMRRKSGCNVERVPFSTIGNICYYVSEKGDVYGMQTVQGKRLTRTKKCQKNKDGWSVRLSSAPHKESYFALELLTYCTFILHRWSPDVELEFKNGNPHDVRPDNLRPHKEMIPPEWSEHMEWRKDVYKSNFLRVANSVNYVTGIDIEDCKDVAQSAFIYICTSGYSPRQEQSDIVGLWIKIARLRAIDYLRCRWIADSEMVERQGQHDKPYEVDLFHLQPGKRRQTYLRMWAEGNTPTEIAKECGATRSTVACSVTRSIQFLQRYFKQDIAI